MNTFIGILGGLEGVATDLVEGFIAATVAPHLVVTQINCILCIRDKNPTDVPLVKEVWFQVADELLPRIPPARGQGSAREEPVTQIDDHSSGEDPLTPSEDPSEPTQMEPPGRHESAPEAPLSLAKARLLHSHVEAVVTPTKNTLSLVARPSPSPCEENK